MGREHQAKTVKQLAKMPIRNPEKADFFIKAVT
jgi:hypothetical protein